MSLKEIVWSQYLEDDSPIPPDVTFRLIENENVVGELKAHKYLLASVSSVFRAQFFGKLAEIKDVIDIKESSYFGFKFLLEYIYTGSSLFSGDYDLIDVIEIFNLAEKYDIQTLKDLIPEKLNNLEIEEDNVMDVIRISEVFHHFKPISKLLQSRCSDFLKLGLKSEDQVQQFSQSFAKTSEDCELLIKLLDNSNNVEEYDGCDPQQTTEEEENDPGDLQIATMCLKNVDWFDYLESDSEIPPDVTFEIRTLQDSSNNEIIGVLKAHKFHLSIVSSVFRDIFFSENLLPNLDIVGEVTDNKVEIIGPSFKAFKVMIDYMYGKYPSLRGANEICEIFEIINLADQFSIEGLEEEYRTAMFLYFRHK